MRMRDLKAKVNQTVQDTIVATHIVDGSRNPPQHGAYLKSHANFPLEYVSPLLIFTFHIKHSLLRQVLHACD